MSNFTNADYLKSNLIVIYSIGIITLLSGLLIQSFIVAVNVNDWMRGRAITDADKIITALGISRLFYHTAYLLYYALSFCLSEFDYIHGTDIIITASYLSNICLTTLFSIFIYCKISTIHNIFFLHLKTFILKRIVCLIIACVLCSMVYSSINDLITFNPFFNNYTDIFLYRQEQMKLGWNLVWNIFPLLIFFTASILLLIFLGFHICKMNEHGNTMSSADTYHRNMKFTVFSFLTTALYIAVPLIEIATGSVDIMWIDFTVNIFPALHSVLLIYVATKLRNQFFRIVRCGINSSCNRNAPGPQSGEMVEVTRL